MKTLEDVIFAVSFHLLFLYAWWLMYEKPSHSLKSREQINLLVPGTQSSGSVAIAVNGAAFIAWFVACSLLL